MEDGKDRMIGIVGTSAFHLLLILFLLLVYLNPSLSVRNTEDMGGVPVMFGNVADAYGDNEPRGRGDGTPNESVTVGRTVTEDPVAMRGAPPKSSGTNKPNQVVTQNNEETVSINKPDDEAVKRQAAEAAERRRQQAEAERVAQAQAQQKSQIGNQMSGLFGNGDGDGSRGNTQGSGTQGVPTGNASFGETSGVGGWVGSYNLDGRTLGRGGLIRPNYSANDYGTVVVDIVVDPKGNVVAVELGKGTNTTSAALKAEALRASRNTKFNPISSVINQKGKITYKFNLN